MVLILWCLLVTLGVAIPAAQNQDCATELSDHCITGDVMLQRSASHMSSIHLGEDDIDDSPVPILEDLPGKVEVGILRAADLLNDHWWNAADPYVIVNVCGQKAQTNVLTNKNDPVWNWKHTFNVDYDCNTVKLELWDEDSGLLGSNDKYHEQELGFRANPDETKTRTLKLDPTGSLDVSIAWMPRATTHSRHNHYDPKVATCTATFSYQNLGNSRFNRDIASDFKVVVLGPEPIKYRLEYSHPGGRSSDSSHTFRDSTLKYVDGSGAEQSVTLANNNHDAHKAENIRFNEACPLILDESQM